MGLHNVPPVLVRRVLLWVAHLDTAAGADDHDLAPPVEHEEDAHATVNFSNSVGIAGLLHIIHNGAKRNHASVCLRLASLTASVDICDPPSFPVDT